MSLQPGVIVSCIKVRMMAPPQRPPYNPKSYKPTNFLPVSIIGFAKGSSLYASEMGFNSIIRYRHAKIDLINITLIYQGVAFHFHFQLSLNTARI